MLAQLVPEMHVVLDLLRKSASFSANGLWDVFCPSSSRQQAANPAFILTIPATMDVFV